MDDSIKQALIDRFRGYLDMVEDGEESPDDPGETADLFSVLVEMAALRSEVRTESRLVKEALEQFRGVFDSLQASQATLQRELDRRGPRREIRGGRRCGHCCLTSSTCATVWWRRSRCPRRHGLAGAIACGAGTGRVWQLGRRGCA